MKKIDFQQKTEPITPDEALAKLENYCAYRERSPAEVQKKLKDLGMEGEDAAQILTVLENDNFFNEERFAHAFAGGKFRMNEWGKVKIRTELRLRGIQNRFIEAALTEIPDREYWKTLEKLAERKMATLPPGEPFKNSQKLGAYLMRCGFEQELVFQYLNYEL